jgi:hypothetical protein
MSHNAIMDDLRPIRIAVAIMMAQENGADITAAL